MSRWTTEAYWLGHAEGDDTASGDEPLRRFEAWCAAHPGSRCVVWLGSSLLTPLLVGPGLALQGDPALRAWARRVFAHYGVAASAPLATWRSGQRLGAVALEGLDLQALRTVSRRHRVHLAGLRPGWALALHTLGSRSPGLGRGTCRAWLREPGLLTALQIEDGRLTGIDQHWTAGGAGGLMPGDGEPVFDAPQGSCPAKGPSVPDFLAPTVRREGWAGWALATTGALVLVVAMSEAGWIGVPSVTPESAPTRAVSTAPAGAAESTGLNLAWVALAGHPWAGAFAAGERASEPGLYWLRFEHEAARQELRLAGVASDMALVLAAAERLAEAPGVSRSLLAHSESSAADGGPGVRFEVQAQYGRGAPERRAAEGAR